MSVDRSVRKKPGLSWAERAEELHTAGSALYRAHVETGAELRVTRARLETATGQIAWAAAHPWRALWRRLAGRGVG